LQKEETVPEKQMVFVTQLKRTPTDSSTQFVQYPVNPSCQKAELTYKRRT